MADQVDRSSDDILPDGKLPGDVMVSILIKLPIKSLMKFQAVSDSWYSFISSSRFFESHLRRQSVVAPNHCFLSLGNGSKDDDEDDSEDVDLQLGILDFTHHYYSPAAVDGDALMLVDHYPEYDLPLLDSCNGLLCFGGVFKTYDAVLLWNPSPRRQKPIGVPKEYDLDFSTLGLCYVDAIHDFKILVWKKINGRCDDTPYLYVYSLSSNSWEEVRFYAPKTKIDLEAPTFLGSCMHWLVHRCPQGTECKCSSATEIVVFDVINRAKSWFRRLPVSCGRHHLSNQQTLVIGGCLSILIYFDTNGNAQESGIGIRVMEQYGVEGSWVKRYFILVNSTHVKCPIVSWNDGEIVFIDEANDSKVLVFVDLYSGNSRYVRFSSYYVKKFFKYVESLASVD